MALLIVGILAILEMSMVWFLDDTRPRVTCFKRKSG